MFKDRVEKEVTEGKFILYVTRGDRHPSLEFGWVDEIVDNSDSGVYANGQEWKRNSFKVKIVRADPNGTRHTKTVVDVQGHWRDDTPDYIQNYSYGRNAYTRTQEDYDNYWVDTTYRDTGKPDTTRLEVNGLEDNRLMVIDPVV